MDKRWIRGLKVTMGHKSASAEKGQIEQWRYTSMRGLRKKSVLSLDKAGTQQQRQIWE